MRKTVIALMLVLPMVFVLVIFSSVNLVSISVPVSVSGIRMLADGDRLGDGEALYVDIADGQTHKVTAEVEPANASEKGYTLSCDNPEVLEVSSDGTIKAVGIGNANVTAVSKDKGFTDSIPVVVSSTKAYDVRFTLYDGEGRQVPLAYSENSQTYSTPASLRLESGKYSYKAEIVGGSSKEYSLSSSDGVAVVNKGEESLLLPFSGNVRLELKVDDAVVDGITERSLVRKINLRVTKQSSLNGIVVNGVADGATVLLAKGAQSTVVYAECDGEPTLTGDGIKETVCLTHGETRASSVQHQLLVVLEEDFDGEKIFAQLSANGKTVPVTLSFAEFDFDLRSVGMTYAEDVYKSVVLCNTPTSFYAVSPMDAAGVTYKWSVSEGVKVSPDGDSSCTLVAEEERTFVLTVTALRDGNELCSKRIEAESVVKVNSVFISNNVKTDLAERYTVGGLKYGSDGIVDNDGYAVNIRVTKQGDARPAVNDLKDIVFTSSQPSVATVKQRDGTEYLVPHGTGAITITAQWKYNDLFDSNATGYIKLNVVKDAVEVDNYPDLKAASEAGEKIVLTADIMLGTNRDGSDMSLNECQAIAQRQKYESTYNKEFYSVHPDYRNLSTEVTYAMEFKADVYGNGFDLNAENFTNATDASGKPQIFCGPLVFVEYKGVASVAGQDNCAFLVRTDGVTLYGVNLLGCSDDSLFEEQGGVATYQLNNLNKLGTTLEINADCSVINCRIRNGRNTVRVYGGNKNGDNYFTILNGKEISDGDRIEVEIVGCVITQGREFLVKVGANKALRSYYPNGQEPQLFDQNGVAYAEQKKIVGGKTYGTNVYDVGDSGKEGFFYKHYVMTDLTVQDSVLETSGLFCIGVESNFAGALLYEGAKDITGAEATYANVTANWRKSGGTSFASVLRLAGDVRTYDWKDAERNIDSSTLIEPVGDGVLSEVMKFNVAAMLKEVDGKPEYAKLLDSYNGASYVHGGIAFYGGGRNYSQIDLSALNDSVNNFTHLSVNIGQFADSGNATVKRQAELLPLAAGTHDFNFWLYTADCANNYSAQREDTANGTRYSGLTKPPLFGD